MVGPRAILRPRGSLGHLVRADFTTGRVGRRCKICSHSPLAFTCAATVLAPASATMWLRKSHNVTLTNGFSPHMVPLSVAPRGNTSDLSARVSSRRSGAAVPWHGLCSDPGIVSDQPADLSARTEGTSLRLMDRVRHAIQPVRSERGLTISPDATFESVAALDIICVPASWYCSAPSPWTSGSLSIGTGLLVVVLRQASISD